MELIGIKENPIKIKRTIFNMEPRIEMTTKIARNMDSGTTQLQQLATLARTLLRLEAIRIGAYERWQPFFNEGHQDFFGLLAYLDIFHSDHNVIGRLNAYFKNRQAALTQLKKNRSNENALRKLYNSKAIGLELMEELREKIYDLQFPKNHEFQTYTVR
jgi:hypothetical protein